jgi:lysozyme
MTTPKHGKPAGFAAVLLLVAGFVAHHEGYIPRTYADPIGIPTACYGHTGTDVTPGREFSRAECEALLEGDLAEAYADVTRCIRAPMRDHQAAALTSFAFNVGGGALCKSTLARLANQGRWAEACAQLDRWVYAGKRKLPGLVKRRAAERAMCEGRA